MRAYPPGRPGTRGIAMAGPEALAPSLRPAADSLDIPGYAVKALLNHKGGSDVTAGYVIASTERPREPMQKITDYVLRCAGVEISAQVLPFERADRPQLRVTT